LSARRVDGFCCDKCELLHCGEFTDHDFSLVLAANTVEYIERWGPWVENQVMMALTHGWDIWFYTRSDGAELSKPDMYMIKANALRCISDITSSRFLIYADVDAYFSEHSIHDPGFNDNLLRSLTNGPPIFLAKWWRWHFNTCFMIIRNSHKARKLLESWMSQRVGWFKNQPAFWLTIISDWGETNSANREFRAIHRITNQGTYDKAKQKVGDYLQSRNWEKDDNLLVYKTIGLLKKLPGYHTFRSYDDGVSSVIVHSKFSETHPPPAET